MYKAERFDVQYIIADTIEHQGKRKSIEVFLKNGYKPIQRKGTYWLLKRPEMVIVTVYYEKNRYSFNMRDAILMKYNEYEITEELLSRFESDVRAGKLTIEVDRFGYSIF